MTIENASITSFNIGFESHDILTAMLNLKYHDDTHQGFGGYFCDIKHGANLATFVRRVLEIVGVDDIAKVNGKIIRIRWNNHRIEAIGHALKDQWFDPKEEMK